jgi:hypothetical protein
MVTTDPNIEDPSMFALEEHLEEFLVKNWAQTLFGKDYDIFVPVIEAMIQKHGRIRIVLEMHGFHGWDASALWEDIKFDWKHYSDIERIAMVGNSKWEQGMAIFCRPFTSAKIRYFPDSKRQEALSWVAAA